jgi:hypothetical protein
VRAVHVAGGHEVAFAPRAAVRAELRRWLDELGRGDDEPVAKRTRTNAALNA